ncbi:MAG: GGDEF domain-containing protein [Desulfuromonadaceae bacterium]|jgi:diguanylate cyclase (GGDEF)-like protein
MNISPQSLHEVVESLPDPAFILTESGRYAAIFGGTDTQFYHDGKHLIGKYLHDVLPPQQTEVFLAQIRMCLKQQCMISFEYGLTGADVAGLNEKRGPDGQIWFDGRISPLSSTFEGERAVLWVARNITERYILEEKLRRSSDTDPLTGIYNRRRFVAELRERFSEFKRYATPTALILFDIDFFKRINDTYGHQCGDEMLCRLCDMCKQYLRNTDIFARFGGEEFIVLLPSTSLAQALKLAERLRVKTMECKCGPGLSISLGVSCFEKRDSSEDAVISRADEAMYRAKNNGRNRVEAYATTLNQQD